jgi:hypothetical protein
VGVLIDIDGVMRRPQDNAPIREGFRLYNQIKMSSMVTFLCEDKEEATHFLRSNKVLKYDNIKDTKSLAPGDDVWVRLIKSCRVTVPVDFVVTANLALVPPLLEAGIATLAFCIPSYLDARFMPDGRQGRQTWAQITGEIERQQDLLANDNRL